MVLLDKSKEVVVPDMLFGPSDKPPVPVWSRLMVVDRVNPVHPAGRAPWVIVRVPVSIVALTRVPVLTGTLKGGVFTVVVKLTPWAPETVVSELRDGVIVIESAFPKLPPEVVAANLTLKGLGRVTFLRGMVTVPPWTKSTGVVLLANTPELPIREICEAVREKFEVWPVIGAKSNKNDPEAKVAELKSVSKMETSGRVAEVEEAASVSTTVMGWAARCPFTVDRSVAFRSKLPFWLWVWLMLGTVKEPGVKDCARVEPRLILFRYCAKSNWTDVSG
jgi:hypothetical protein